MASNLPKAHEFGRQNERDVCIQKSKSHHGLAHLVLSYGLIEIWDIDS
jgi:hypothetical protein